MPVQPPGTKIWGPKPISGTPSTAGLYGLAYNPTNDRIYVCHFRARNIFIYSSDSLLTSFGTIPTPNNETACTDIKYCAYDNTFWVASYQTKRVYKISATGTVLRQFANPANDYPTGLCWDENERLLYLADRRGVGVLPGYIYVVDTLGNRIRQMIIPLNANVGPRCLALEKSGGNPNRPTLCHLYTSFNAAGNAVDSVGVYELNRDNAAILQRFLITERYNARGVEYDPRDASLWVTIMEMAAGGPNNYIVKYAGFHQPGTSQEEPDSPVRDISRVRCLPNPFNRTLLIAYQLKRGGDVRVTIHDAAGRMLTCLAEGRQNSGTYYLTWDGKDLSGIYFVNIRTNQENLWYKVIKF